MYDTQEEFNKAYKIVSDHNKTNCRMTSCH